MRRLPNTEVQRIQQIENGRRQRTRGVVIHIMDGTLSGTLSWWRRRGNNIGTHLCIGIKKAVQTADLDALCYHAPGDNKEQAGRQYGNSEFIGIEHEGRWYSSWLTRRTQRKLSANRCAWILYHYKCGKPKWGVNIVRHSSFTGTTHKNCPGKLFPVPLYMAAVNRAYKNLEKSRGRTWEA